MLDDQFPGVQSHGRLANIKRLIDSQLAVDVVRRVVNNWQTEMPEMDSNLVRSPRFGPTFYQAGFVLKILYFFRIESGLADRCNRPVQALSPGSRENPNVAAKVILIGTCREHVPGMSCVPHPIKLGLNPLGDQSFSRKNNNAGRIGIESMRHSNFLATID